MKRIFGFLLILLMVMTVAVSAGTPKSLVRIETNYGDITLELYPDKAPVTVENFLDYVNSNFYEGIIFHRVIENFMIQAGVYDTDLYTFLEDPNFSNPNWSKDPLYYREPGDPIINEASNGLKNLRGTIAMARTSDPNSATAQFFINHKNNSSLDYRSGSAGYCVFGSVLDGLSTVDTIAELPTDEINSVLEDIPKPNGAVINRVTEIFSFGSDSSDFSDIPFLHAQGGNSRSFFGQGIYHNNNYTHIFTETVDSVLNVNCLKWQRQVDEPNALGDFTIYLTRDETDEIWVSSYTFDGRPVVDANSIYNVVRLSDLEDEMVLRLISGAVDSDNPDDPNRLIITGTEPNEVRQQIVSFTGSLDHLPMYDDELVIVKTWNPTDEDDVGWSFYHDTVGLVLDLRHRSLDSGNPKFFDPADTSEIDTGWDGWRGVWFGKTEPVFDNSSKDFSEVEFSGADPKMLRLYRGQGAYAEMDYKMLGSQEKYLGVLCLKIEETAVTAISRPASTLLMARDTNDNLWIFRDAAGGETVFEATQIDQIVPFENYTDIHLRLMAEDFETGTQISLGQGDDQRVSEVLGVNESLENQSAYDDKLVLVKLSEGENEDLVSWNFYHKTVGLALDIWPNMDDPNAGNPDNIDPNDDGWHLAEPVAMTSIFGVFTPSRNRSNPKDRFRVWGKFTAEKDDFEADKLFVRVGPWQTTIATKNNPAFKKLGNRDAYLYQGSSEDGGKVTMLIHLGKGIFRIIGRDVDLTGLNEPVPVSIVIGDYFGQATARVRGRGLSLKFLSNYEDRLQCNWFRFAYDSGSNDNLLVLGGIATKTYPLDLTKMKVEIYWGSKKYSIDAGKLTQLQENRYRYRNRSGKLRSAHFDLKKCRFRIYIAKDNLALLPRNLIIKFTDEDDTVIFNESVEVKVGK